MKKLLQISMIFLFCALPCVFSQEDKPLNEIPMYGGDKITEYQNKINQDFINGIKKIIETEKSLKDLHEGSEYMVNKGWEAFRKGKYAEAIKRFNQAWLLDPNNADVYWGFGNYLGVQEEFEESIKMLNKSIEIDSTNVIVMEDLAKSYNMNGFKNASEGKVESFAPNLEKAIKVIEKALIIKKTSGLYHHYAVSLFYLKRYTEAKVKIDIAIKMGENVDKSFLSEINEKLK